MKTDRLEVIGIAAVVAAVVIGAALFRDVDQIPLVIGAGIIAALGFVAFDTLLSRSPLVAIGGGQPLPQTSIGDVQAPLVGEPDGVPQPSEEPVTKAAKLDPSLFEEDSIEVKASKASSRIFTIRVAKHGSGLAECEDAVSIDPRRVIVSVADGASSSFGSGEWAGVLTKNFIATPPKPLSVGSFSRWVANCRNVGDAAAGSPEQGGWWSEEGARRGAFATLVGAIVTSQDGDQSATVMCLGDSCAFLLRPMTSGMSVRRSIPYEDASQFGSHPSLLSSSDEHGHDEPSWTVLPVQRGDILVLGTDAVSEWLLGDQKRFELLSNTNPAEIAKQIVAERAAGHIVNDDMTLAVLEIQG